MLEKRILDLGRTDAVAGAGDDVILAAHVPEIPVLILPAEIAGQKKTAGMFLARRFRIAPIFDHGHGIGLAHADDAAAPPRQFLALVVDDADVESRRRLAHRAGLDRKKLCIVADHEIAFGLAEHFVSLDAECGPHPVQQFDAERLAAGKDAAQLYAGMFDVGDPHQF